MDKEQAIEQEKIVTKNHLTVEDSKSADDAAPLKISNPDGVRRAIGIFRDEPLLDDLMDNIKELREEQRNSIKAA